MKLDHKRTVLVGLAFLSICAFWQMYDNIIPLILTNTFHLDETISGAIMAADNVLALFLLPFFGALSDKTSTRIGRRMPFIVGGTALAAVLMNLIRGCGLKGLSGIPERRGNVIRPMLAVSPREIGTYLDQRRIPHMEDETNTDQTYARNRVRYQLLPLLEELNPQAVSHIAAAALRVREDEQELDRQEAVHQGPPPAARKTTTDFRA